jgi:hypothetical protein
MKKGKMKLVQAKDIHYKDTLNAWQPFYKEKLTKADAVEIQANLIDLRDLLCSWKEKERA